MAWQTSTINPATTSPAQDISKIVNDLSVLKGVIGGTPDAAVPSTWTTALAALQQAFNSGTTGGTSTAFTLTPSTAIAAYTAGMTFWVTFHAASGAAPTLQISGVASPPNLVRQLGDGTYANIGANDIPANHRSRVTLISATQALVEDMPAPAAGSLRPFMMANGGAEFGMVNRIINGRMEVDQYRNGASVTPAAGTTYIIDRFNLTASQASKFSAQQNAGAVTPPAGFKNYLGFTSLSAYTALAADYFLCEQVIEGLNVTDLGWGTANAQPITVSFWVRSSLTGTHSGSLRNGALNRSYPFTFTVNAANTWEQKFVNIAGDTSGTWAVDNTGGVRVNFDLGTGSTYRGTAGAWAGASYAGATGAVSVVGTSGATFYATGVDFRKGTFTSAPPTDWRPYGVEDALCKRYLPVADGGGAFGWFVGQAGGTTSSYIQIPLSVTPRVVPTGITLSAGVGSYALTTAAVSQNACTVLQFNAASISSVLLNAQVASGLVAGNATMLNLNGNKIIFTGCEL